MDAKPSWAAVILAFAAGAIIGWWFASQPLRITLDVPDGVEVRGKF